MYLTGQYKIPELATLLEVHPNTLWKWLKRTDVREAITEMQSATHNVVQAQLKAMTLKASNKLLSLMDSPIDGVALQAVKDVLDRGGHKAEQKIKKTVEVKSYEEKLSDLINDSIDVDYKVVE